MKTNHKAPKQHFKGQFKTLKPHTIYWSTTIILLLTPILAFIYLGLLLGDHKQSLKTILQGNPLISIMLIVALVDLMFSYYLWQYHDRIIDQRPSLKAIYLILLISQILLGNIFLVVLASLGLYQLKAVKKTISPPLKSQWFFLGFFIVIYTLCIIMLARVYLF